METPHPLYTSFLHVFAVVSRHKGAVEWLAKQLGGYISSLNLDEKGNIIDGSLSLLRPVHDHESNSMRELELCYPIYGNVYRAEQIRDVCVYGNLPLHLAAECRAVCAISFRGTPPRGTEYTADDMDKAGAYLAWFEVSRFGQDKE